MDWQQLRGFYHVATLKSFTRAAEVMYRSQSALSHQIKALEEEYGCQLFERMGKRKVVLTDAGECLLRLAEDVMVRYDAFSLELDKLKRGQAGTVRVTMAPATSLMLMPGAVQSFKEKHPGISITLYERIPTTVVDMVNKGLADFGVGMSSITPSSLAKKPLCSAHFLLLAPEGHPLTAKGVVTIEDLAKLPLIVPPETQNFAARHKIARKAAELGISLNIILESNNIPITAEYVQRGLGIGFLTAPVAYTNFSFKGLTWIVMDQLFEPDSICIFYRERTVEALPPDVFLRFMLGYAKKSFPCLERR